MFKPLLAAKVKDLNALTYPLLASAKLDGIRCLTMGRGPVTRKLKAIPNDHIREELKSFGLVGLDGELVTLDAKGEIKPFAELQGDIMRREGEPDWRYFVFDCWLGPHEPYSERLKSLQGMIQGLEPYAARHVVALPQHLVESADGAEGQYDHLIDQGFEGIILRSPDAPYKFGRSTVKEQMLLKHKPLEDDEAEIVGFVELMHNDNPAEKDNLGHTKRSSSKAGKVGAGRLGALVLGWGGLTFECGTGFNEHQRLAMWERRADLMGLPVTFTYQGVGSNGRPRFPVFKAIREEFRTR